MRDHTPYRNVRHFQSVYIVLEQGRDGFFPEIFDVTLESDFVDISLAADVMEFIMDSETWKDKEVVAKNTTAVTDDSIYPGGVNEAPLSSNPKIGIPIQSPGSYIILW